MQHIDPKICSILRFTNNPGDDDIVIQDCGESYDRLKGYDIVLNKSKIPAMKILLMDYFSKYKDFINKSFVDKDIQEIRQHCKVYSPDGYIDLFIKEYGGLDLLMVNGPSGIPSFTKEEDSTNSVNLEVIDLDESDFVDDEEDEEVEDENMIRELNEKIDSLTSDLESKSSECESYKEKLELYESKYPKEEFKEEYLEAFMDIVEANPESLCRDALYNIIIKLHKDGDIKEISRIIAGVLTQFDEMGVE